MAGSVTIVHPDYSTLKPIWDMMRDCVAGEETIKLAGERYLIMPSGFRTIADGGVAAYNAYQQRAKWPDILIPTLSGMVGVIHKTEAQIEGLEEGKPLEQLWERATKDGLPLEAFHRRITAEILLMGRYSILVDVPSEERTENIPYLAGYGAEFLVNWSDPERDLFVLDEKHYERQDIDEFAWVEKPQHRVLRLRDGEYTAQVYNAQGTSEEEITPRIRGGKALDEIPLVVVGPREISLTLELPPLQGVARASLAIYRLDADYRHQLYNAGQETFVIVGQTDNIPRVIGSGVILGLPAGSDAKLVGPSGVGIAAHRQAIADEHQSAVAAGVKLFDAQQRSAESGDALRLRFAAQTATLTTIALASASALERALRFAARFVGQDPEEIVVKPNTTFIDTSLAANEITALVQTWQAGAISKTTLYENLQRAEIASAERTFEEEQELIDQEAIDTAQAAPQYAGAAGGGAPGVGSTLPSRFIETGQGLTVERAGGTPTTAPV